jgi:acyl-CoA reductase-like NAD-dependent aldehyde dehydrogenase
MTATTEGHDAVNDRAITTAMGAQIAGEIVVSCPADGRVVGSVPSLDAEAVAAEAARLRAAQVEWEAIGFSGRRQWLGKFRDWLLDNEDRLHRIVRDESGKAWGDLAMGEVPVAVEVLNYYMKHGEKFLSPQTPRPHSLAMIAKKLVVERSPYPLVGVITPWNAQISNPMLDIPAALMAGCAVLSKPSEETPLAWSEVVRGWQEDLGAPHVLGCVTGAGATGAAVVDVVDMIQFTGSTPTAARSARALVSVSSRPRSSSAARTRRSSVRTPTSTAPLVRLPGGHSTTPGRSASRSSGSTSKNLCTTSSSPSSRTQFPSCATAWTSPGSSRQTMAQC